MDDKRNLKIILGALGCLGCLGVIAVMGFLGLGYWVASTRMTAPSAPMVAPVPPGGPLPQAQPSAQAGDWSSYIHQVACPNNPNLRLVRFETTYPSNHIVLPCQAQEPRPWAYVTFHLEDAQDAVDQQITLGFARGLPTQAMLEGVAAQMVAQMGAPPPRLLGTAPFAARGEFLMRRDAVFTVPTAFGAFAPGAYLVRQVVVPGPGLNAEGILVTMLRVVRTNEPDALRETDPALLRAVESIRF